jgi:3-dehydroquinate synthase
VAFPSQTIALSTSSASYDITIGQGLLATLHPRLLQLAAGKPFRPFLITSPNVWKLWSRQVRASFPEAQSPTVLFHPAGEKHKRFSAVETLAEQLAEHGADRDSLLLAFGGGVIGDITGFLAAIYMRGIPCVQIPTTLLAQVDSSVGGKTGVNLAVGKNLIGSFHQPRAVLADIDLLATLPAAELRAGLQESIKAGIIQDTSLFSYLEQNAEKIKAGDPSCLAHVVAASVQVKAGVVQQDEHESGPRMTLNFGHTIGHAIEAATGYKRLLHGEAVAWGSIAALHVGLARNAITAEAFARMANLILAYGPLPRFKASAEIVFDVTDEELLAATRSMLKTMRATGRAAKPAKKAKNGKAA